MKCPVCKTECYSNPICAECGFDDLTPVFLTKEDGEEWYQNVVLHRRTVYWETLDSFDIEGTEIVDYYGDASAVIVPYGVESIGEDAFKNNKSIRAIYFPETIKSIEKMAFYSSGLATVVFSSSVERIGDDAFGHTNVLSIWIPPTCKYVGTNAFACCPHLKTIQISNGVEQISAGAFSRCNNVESVIIPASVTTVGDAAFSTGSLKLSFAIDPRNKVFSVVGNCLVEKGKGRIISGSLSEPIPSDIDVHTIGKYAFESCKNVNSILTIPPNISVIESGAFCMCEITEAYIPNSVREIDYAAFFFLDKCRIYCESKREPAQWSSEWCGGNDHTILWGKRWKTKSERAELVLLDKNKFCATLISYSFDDAGNSMKMFVRLVNNSDLKVRFVITDLSIDEDATTTTHWCDVAPNTEVRCEFIFKDSEFRTVYLSESEEITFTIQVKYNDGQYIFAQGEPVTLPGFYEPDDEDEAEDEEDDDEW